MNVSSTMMVTAGARSGKMMRRKTAHSPAPSMRAASTYSSGTALMPARKTMVGKPSQRHAFTTISVSSAVEASPSQGRASAPACSSVRTLFTRPKTGLRKSAHKNPTMTSDSITGRKKMTRYPRAPQGPRASSTASPSAVTFWSSIVAMKTRTLCQNALTSNPAYGKVANRRAKFARPTNPRRPIPSQAYRLNASADRIGYVMNAANNTVAGPKKKTSHHRRLVRMLTRGCRPAAPRYLPWNGSNQALRPFVTSVADLLRSLRAGHHALQRALQQRRPGRRLPAESHQHDVRRGLAAEILDMFYAG